MKCHWRAGVLSAGLLAMAPADVSRAQSSRAAPSAAAPPATVAGFRSERATSRSQVNTCTEARCVPGSKVSYILYPPDLEPDFERFKTMRSQIQRSLEQRLPPGTRISFEPPRMTSDDTTTIFEARRTETSFEGQTRTVITRQFYSKRMAVEMISTSTDAQVAEANLALFQIPLLLTSEGGSEQAAAGKKR